MLRSLIGRLAEWRATRQALGDLADMQRNNDESAAWEFDEHISNAKIMLENGKRDDALEQWRTISIRFGSAALKSPKSLHFLIAMGCFDEAEELAQSGIRLYPGTHFYYTEYAESARQKGDMSESNRRWGLVRKKFPGIPAGYTKGAECLRHLGKPEEASALIAVATRKFPGDFECWLEDARCTELRGENEVALARWESLRQRFPHHAACTTGLADCLSRLGRIEESEKILETSQPAFPRELSIWANFAWSAHNRADWPEAMLRWQVVRKRFPLSPLGYTGGIAVLREIRDFDGLDLLLLKATERFPDDVGFARDYSMLPMNREDWLVAATRWDTYRMRFPDREEGFLHGADALDAAGHHCEADQLRAQHATRFGVNPEQRPP